MQYHLGELPGAYFYSILKYVLLVYEALMRYVQYLKVGALHSLRTHLSRGMCSIPRHRKRRALSVPSKYERG